MTLREKKIKRVYDRMNRKNLREKAFEGEFKVFSLFETDPDLKTMRKPFEK